MVCTQTCCRWGGERPRRAGRRRQRQAPRGPTRHGVPHSDPGQHRGSANARESPTHRMERLVAAGAGPKGEALPLPWWWNLLGRTAGSTSSPIELKGEVLTVLTKEIPEALVSTLPAFISSASPLVDTAVKHKGTASGYCVDLLSLLLLRSERLLPMLPQVLPSSRSPAQAPGPPGGCSAPRNAPASGPHPGQGLR